MNYFNDVVLPVIAVSLDRFDENEKLAQKLSIMLTGKINIDAYGGAKAMSLELCDKHGNMNSTTLEAVKKLWNLS